MTRIITNTGGEKVFIYDGSIPEPDHGRNLAIRQAYAELDHKKAECKKIRNIKIRNIIIAMAVVLLAWQAYQQR